jgi:hypothetical protein
LNVLKQVQRFGVILCFLAFAPLISGCAGRDGQDLTPRQKAYDLATKYEGFQIIAEQAVTNPQTPEVVKNAIKAATSVATQAVIDYTEAAKRGDVNLATYLAAGIDAMSNLIVALTQYGFITIPAPGPTTSQLARPPDLAVFIVQPRRESLL